MSTRNINGVMTVSRVAQNSIEVRLGAMFGNRDDALVPRTYDVTALLLFPLAQPQHSGGFEDYISTDVVPCSVATFTAQTTFRNSRNGKVARPGNVNRLANKVADILENANIEKASVGKTNVDQVEKASSEKTNADKAEKMNGEKKIVATLAAKLDSQGHLLSIPVVTFFQTGGYPFTSVDILTITATYNNPTNNLLRNGAMGIVVGYFVPQDPAALNNLRHPAHASLPDMSHMSHDH